MGAGISLDQLFSTVDNDSFGCGSKITHSLTQPVSGVMEGADSDLRTGLPCQMVRNPRSHAPARRRRADPEVPVGGAAANRPWPSWWAACLNRRRRPASRDGLAASLLSAAGLAPLVGSAAPPRAGAVGRLASGRREPLPPALLREAP